jgi:hypothetical protein
VAHRVLVVHQWVVVLLARVLVLVPVEFLQVLLVAVQLEPVDQCVHLVQELADLVVLALVVLVVLVLVVLAVVQVVLVVLVLVVPVAVLVVLVPVVLAVVLVVLVLVVPVAVLVVVATVNVVRQRKSRVLVVVKTSTKCCHRQPRRIRKAMHPYLRV